jgi:integrase
LIAGGLLEYVAGVRAAGHAQLWPRLRRYLDGYGHRVGKWYQGHNRRHVTENPKRVFHSLRNNVANGLKQAGVAESIIAELLGHAHKSITTGRYGKAYGPGVLLEALRRLEYGVTL